MLFSISESSARLILEMTPSDVKVVVIDDVQSMRVQVKEILRSCGFTNLRSAANGVEGLRLLIEESADLLICDWHTAPMSGLELLKEVRAREGMKNTTFIMLTAEGTRERVIEAVKAGVDDYIVKPLTPDLMQLKVVGALLKRKVF